MNVVIQACGSHNYGKGEALLNTSPRYIGFEDYMYNSTHYTLVSEFSIIVDDQLLWNSGCSAGRYQSPRYLCWDSALWYTQCEPTVIIFFLIF